MLSTATCATTVWREASFSYATPDAGVEFITLEIGPEAGDAYYLDDLMLMESAYPGSVVGISVASAYAGDAATEWRDVYRRAAGEGQPGYAWWGGCRLTPRLHT